MKMPSAVLVPIDNSGDLIPPSFARSLHIHNAVTTHLAPVMSPASRSSILRINEICSWLAEVLG